MLIWVLGKVKFRFIGLIFYVLLLVFLILNLKFQNDFFVVAILLHVISLTHFLWQNFLRDEKCHTFCGKNVHSINFDTDKIDSKVHFLCTFFLLNSATFKRFVLGRLFCSKLL
jgi:hypothetical protein